MVHEATSEVYQLHVWIRQISPMIWRRLLVRSDSTLAQLHHTLQIAFGWSDHDVADQRVNAPRDSLDGGGGGWGDGVGGEAGRLVADAAVPPP